MLNLFGGSKEPSVKELKAALEAERTEKADAIIRLQNSFANISKQNYRHKTALEHVYDVLFGENADVNYDVIIGTLMASETITLKDFIEGFLPDNRLDS